MNAPIMESNLNCAFDGRFIYFAERQSHQRLPGNGAWIERIGSEGTRPALLPAGPVPERWNVKSVFIETADGESLGGLSC